MSRKSADKIARMRDPHGRQDMWNVIRDHDGPDFTITDIFDETFISRHTIRSYLKALVAGDILERLEPDPDAKNAGAAIRFRIKADPVPFYAPRLTQDGKPVTQGAGVENMWRTMRMLPQFSPRDLAAHATTETVNVSETTAKAYCTSLLQAEYLRVVRQARPPKTQAVYKLINNTGPYPPQIQRRQHLFDPNTRKAHPIGSAS